MKRTRYQFGSLELKQRAKGPAVWVYRFTEPGPEGTVKRRSVRVGTEDEFSTKAQAQRAATTLRLMANPDRPTQTTVTVGTLIARYMAEEIPTRYSTASAYRSYLTTWIAPKWKDYVLSEVKSLSVEKWLDSLPLAKDSRRKIRALMRLLYRCAQRWELIDRNPIDLVRVKGETRRMKIPRVLSPEEFCRVLDHLNEPSRTMALIAGCLGLRVSEIMALRLGDFDWEKLALRVERGSVGGRIGEVKTEYSERKLPLDPDVATAVMRWIENNPYPNKGPEDLLFPNFRTGKPRWQGMMQKLHLIPAGIAAGVGPIGWHNFRHSYRAWLKRLDTPIEVQQELMRHANIQTTLDTYGEETEVSEQHRTAHSNVVKMVLKTGIGKLRLLN